MTRVRPERHSQGVVQPVEPVVTSPGQLTRLATLPGRGLSRMIPALMEIAKQARDTESVQTLYELKDGLIHMLHQVVQDLDKQVDIDRYWKAHQGSRNKADARLDYDLSVSALQADLDVLAKLFVEARGYYDFFLIGTDGDVLYSVEKEADLETNLVTGPWRETGLAEVFRGAMEAAGEREVVFSDFAPYAPSAGEPAMFVATAMLDAHGQVLGVLALQVPTERIKSIMQFTAGMGATGETYLVGEDLLMRSDSRFSADPTILKTEVDTEPVKRALGGESGTMFVPDYRGVTVLSAYSATQVGGFR
jgi:hypothetical protein